MLQRKTAAPEVRYPVDMDWVTVMPDHDVESDSDSHLIDVPVYPGCAEKRNVHCTGRMFMWVEYSQVSSWGKYTAAELSELARMKLAKDDEWYLEQDINWDDTAPSLIAHLRKKGEDKATTKKTDSNKLVCYQFPVSRREYPQPRKTISRRGEK